MNILFLTHHFQTPEEPGAPRPYQIAKYLQDKGNKVTVVTAGTHYMTSEIDSALKGHLWIEENVADISVIKTQALSGYRNSLLKRIASYLIFSIVALIAGLFQKADLVYVGTTPPSITASAYLISRIKKSKLVMEVRELFPEEAVELGHLNSKPVVSAFERYQNWFRRRADKLIALTPGLKDLLVEKNLNEDSIVVNTNAYDRENDKDYKEFSREEARNKLGWEDSFVVLYTGGFGEVNELDTLLKAAELLSSYGEIKFVIIGEGEKKRSYIEYCNEKGLQNCHFLGAKPKQELPKFYKGADVCVQLAPKGDFWKCILANKIFDYLGHGCPVVFAGRGDTADLLREAEAGIVVEPESHTKLKNALLSLHNDPEEIEKMGPRGREYILENYTRKEKLNQLYQEIMSI